jgi:hypothetical protein
MISITKLDVPDYLRAGELYTSLGTGDECFEVPTHVFKSDLQLRDVDDLDHLLESLKYWIVRRPPRELVAFWLLKSVKAAALYLIYHKHRSELPFLIALSQVKMRWDVELGRALGKAIKYGYVEIVAYVVREAERAGGVKWTTAHFGKALVSNNFDCLEFIIKQGCPHDMKPFMYHTTSSIECLTYVLEHCPDYKIVFHHYVQSGNTQIIDCLLSRGHTWTPDTLWWCMYFQQYHLVKHLHERGCNMWGGVTSSAVQDGNIAILRYAHKHGAPWDGGSTAYVATGERGMECLIYAHEHGAPWSEYTTFSAARRDDQLDVLTYAHQHGCPWHPETLLQAANDKSWTCFKYALGHGAPYAVDVATKVAKRSRPMLQYLRERGREWDLQACMHSALTAANLDVARYMRHEGASWPEDALALVIDYGDIALLQFAYEDGVAFNTADAPYRALMRNKPELLPTLHEYGCPWDHRVVSFATQYGHIDGLRYALSHGCPALPPGYPSGATAYRDHPLFQAARLRSRESMDCLLQHGYTLALTSVQLEEIGCERCRAVLGERSCSSVVVPSAVGETVARNEICKVGRVTRRRVSVL